MRIPGKVKGWVHRSGIVGPVATVVATAASAATSTKVGHAGGLAAKGIGAHVLVDRSTPPARPDAVRHRPGVVAPHGRERMRRLGVVAVGVTLVAALLTVGLASPASAASIAATTSAASAASADDHVPIVHTYVQGPQRSAPQPAKGVSPNGCQGTISTLTLETLSSGFNYNCSGFYTNSAGTIAFHLFTGNWSGILYTSQGNILYCDGQSISIPYFTVIEIWLSPTRTSWC